MQIALIAAMDQNRLIGRANQLPWRLPADLRRFKAVTMGKPIVMGRKTFESIGKPLPGRQNIVVSRNAAFSMAGCKIVSDIEQALEACENAAEVLIIGGASFYQQMLPYAQRMYLTHIDASFEGDAWFPVWDPQEWRIVHQTQCNPDESNPYFYRFVDYERLLKNHL